MSTTVKKYLHDMDLQTNRLINARLHPVTTLERLAISGSFDANDEGLFVYDKELKKFFVWDGLVWVDLFAIQATESIPGIAEIATQSEVNTGTDDSRIVTPLKLKTFLDANVGGYSALVGNGAATSFVLTHNFNSRDVNVSVYDSNNYEQVFTDIVLTSNNSVTVSFNTAPENNAYRVVIKK